MKLTLKTIILNAESLWITWRWGKTVTCPYCGSSHTYRGKSRYKCASCGSRFSLKTGSAFHGSNLDIQTIMTAVYLICSDRGISSYCLSAQVGVTQKTAWSLLTRIRFILKQNDLQGADIMTDEVYLGGKVSNMHRKRKYDLCRLYDIPLPEGKMTHSAALALADAHKKHVLCLADETGQVYIEYCPEGFARQRAMNLVYKHAPFMAHLTTDESGLYIMMPDECHSVCCHRDHVYVASDGRSSNIDENTFSWLKGQIDHCHRHISRRWVQGYLNEFSFRRNRKDIETRLKDVMRFISSQRLILKDIL